jgi:hypothetical protein
MSSLASKKTCVVVKRKEAVLLHPWYLNDKSNPVCLFQTLVPQASHVSTPTNKLQFLALSGGTCVFNQSETRIAVPVRATWMPAAWTRAWILSYVSSSASFSACVAGSLRCGHWCTLEREREKRACFVVTLAGSASSPGVRWTRRLPSRTY